MANNVTTFHIVFLLGALMRHMVDEYNAIPRLGVKNIVFLSFTPSFKFRPIQRVEMFRLRQMATFNKLQVA
jgi:hypothetical protein